MWGGGVYFKDPLYAFLLYRIDIFVCRYEYIYIFSIFTFYLKLKHLHFVFKSSYLTLMYT